jgi:hypothetical protein
MNEETSDLSRRLLTKEERTEERTNLIRKLSDSARASQRITGEDYMLIVSNVGYYNNS